MSDEYELDLCERDGVPVARLVGELRFRMSRRSGVGSKQACRTRRRGSCSTSAVSPSSTAPASTSSSGCHGSSGRAAAAHPRGSSDAPVYRMIRIVDPEGRSCTRRPPKPFLASPGRTSCRLTSASAFATCASGPTPRLRERRRSLRIAKIEVEAARASRAQTADPDGEDSPAAVSRSSAGSTLVPARRASARD